MKGLIKRGNTWHVDKVVDGYRIRESCKTTSKRAAEQYLALRMEEVRQQRMFGLRKSHTLAAACSRYLRENQGLRSYNTTRISLLKVSAAHPRMLLRDCYMENLQTWIDDRLAAGIAPSTINKDLATVWRVLHLAAEAWRDESGQTWLATVPKLRRLKHTPKQPHILSWDDQDRLLRLLPTHQQQTTLFALNSGAREGEICALRWDWAVQVEGRTLFILPATFTKNGHERLLVPNDVAQRALQTVRGNHPEYVFTYEGEPIKKLNTSAWKRAWREAKLPTATLKGPHNLRHTYGHRLRAAGVSLETRKDLLGHYAGDITSHYSTASAQELIESANKVQRLSAKTRLRLVDLPRITA